MKYRNLIIFGLLFISFSSYAEEIEFNFQYFRNLFLNESTRRHEIRDENSGLFKKVVFDLDFNLLDSILHNQRGVKIDYYAEDSTYLNSKVKLDAMSYGTLQYLVANYQEGYYCEIPKQYQEYVLSVLQRLIPEDICNDYGFQFVFLKDAKGGLGATFKSNGTIIIPLYTFGTPISINENYLAFLIAHEVAHNFLYNSLFGNNNIEIECNRLACMLLKRAGYSLGVFQEYIDYCYLYQDLFSKGSYKKKTFFYNFDWVLSEDILTEFDMEEGAQFLINESTYKAFREFSIKKALINISSTDRFILEVNIYHSILNLVENPNESIWQVAFLENLRRMLLLDYVKPSWRAFDSKQNPLIFASLPENVKLKYNNNEIGLFGIIEYFNIKDNVVIDNSLKTLITYSDFFNYFLTIENNTTEYKNTKFLYEKFLADTTNNKFAKNDTTQLRYLFVSSDRKKLKFIDTYYEYENTIEEDNYYSNYLLHQKVNESIYYGSTQMLSLLKIGVSEYSKLKYSSIYTYNFLENIDNSKLNLKQINVFRISSKIGVYSLAALAVISQSPFWLGMELGLVVLGYIPFTSIIDYDIDIENKTLSKSKKIEFGNKTTQKDLQLIDTKALKK